jgi:predicted phage terminase large subunit-like protein
MPDLVKQMEETVERWQPQEILFESNAAFKGINDMLVRHASFGRRVIGIQQSKSKAARFAAFAVSVQNGCVRFRKESQAELIDEMTSFPHGAHDDLLDATATGVEHLFGKREPRMW